MHPRSTIEEALRLIGAGLNDCEVGRRLGVPRTTIREWRVHGGPPRGPRRPGDPDCICSGEISDAGAYSYLLGLYLGDGCLTETPRSVFKLRVSLDRRYPGIVAACGRAMSAIRPHTAMKIGNIARPGCVEVNSHWKHWLCLFPQHAPGRKHEREIKLAGWQQEIADTQPDLLLRGLIHSDGWRGLNRVRVGGRSYSYPRYQFCNHSDGIRQIFCGACDALGVPWRRMNRYTIAVSRREAVAAMDRFIGPKT